MIKFSVIVLLYNADPYKLEMTLQSILQQDQKDYEIIITDDGSSTDPSDFIDAYFITKQFCNYTIIRNNTNLGTVKNLYGALQKSKGEYIKAIGAGDLLYSRSTLNEVYDFMKSNGIRSCFGRMKSYSITKEHEIILSQFKTPRCLKEYKRKHINRKRIINDILLYGNWIYGAAMFIERSIFIKCMKPLLNKVTYAEDVFQIMLFLSSNYMHFMDHDVVWYEVGCGISTSANANFRRAINKDKDNFSRYLEKRCPNNKKLIRMIHSRRDLKAGMLNMSLRKYFDNKRWNFFCWLEEREAVKKDPGGFLDTRLTFMKNVN